MSQGELGRIQRDLAVIQRAMGLQLFFGKGMLGFGILLTFVAAVAAVISLQGESAWLQLAPFAAIMVLVMVGLFLRSRHTAGLSHEIHMQVVMSVTTYCIVWVAACGYVAATFLGPTVGFARTALLYATGIGLLLGFALLLIRAALKRREHHYCLGLAFSMLLAGMLLPVLDRHYSYSLAHCCMAVGFLAGVVIQWVQLREAGWNHGAD